MKASLFVLISAWTLMAFAMDYSSTAYEQGSGKQKKLYTGEHKINEKDGVSEIHNILKDLEGKVLVEEKATLKGSEMLRFEIDQKQSNEQGVMEVKDGQVFFTKTSDGKTSTEKEKLGATFITSVNLRRYLQDNWSKVLEGKTIGVRYGVWDRQETVGFDFFKTGQEKIGDQEAVVIKMKPTSFLIAALVKPVILKFSADGSKLLELNGRVPVKKKDGSTFKSLDAEVVYSY